MKLIDLLPKTTKGSLQLQWKACGANIKRRRLEFGYVYAQSALTDELAFNYLQAADDWKRAYDQVSKWDVATGLLYEFGYANALSRHGKSKGNSVALRTAHDVALQMLTNLSRGASPTAWALVEESGNDKLENAVTAYRAALVEYPINHIT